MNRIEWKTLLHSLKRKKKDLEYASIVYQIYGFYWCKLNYLNFQLKMRKNSLLVANDYLLSRANLIKIKKPKMDASTLARTD